MIMRGKTFIVLALWLCFAAAAYADIDINGLEIKMLSTLPQTQQHGYRYYDFVIVNKKTETRRVTLSMEPHRSYRGGSYISYVNKTFSVPPSGSVKATLYRPYISFYDPRLTIDIDGQSVDLTGQFNINSGSSYYWRENKITVLVSKSFPGEIRNFKNNPLSYNKSENEFDYQYPDIPIENWSANWLFYGGYDGIMLTADDLEKMQPAVTDAIDQYVRLGGMLIVYNPELKKKADGRHYGFGREFHTNLTPGKWKKEDWDGVLEAFRTTSTCLVQWKNITPETANSELKVTEDLKIPVRQLFVFMLIFVILIGPLNYFVMKKKRKQTGIIWTSPLIAAFFAAVIIIYAFCSEGFSARMKANSITFLDENSMMASTIGGLAYYCPLVPGSGLMFSDQTELQPIVAYNDGDNRGFGLNLSRGQNLQSGWIKSRIPSHIMLRKGEHRRERLQVLKQSSEGLEVLNGLGAEIKTLQLVYFDGKGYSASDPIAPGKKAVLKPAKIKVKKDEDMYSELSTLLGRSWFKDFTELSISLSKGSYSAVLTESPFISKGLKAKEHSEKCIVVGKLFSGEEKHEN